MKDNNKCLPEVMPMIENLQATYPNILNVYEKRVGVKALGLSDCHVFALALLEMCRANEIRVESYLKDRVGEWHPHTALFVLYSVIDIGIPLKLKVIPAIAQLSDVAYERCRQTEMAIDIEFMHEMYTGYLIMYACDHEPMFKDHQKWFTASLRALERLKKARRIALLNDVKMPVQEALLDMMIDALNAAILGPKIDQRFSYGAINLLTYNHQINVAQLRAISEPVARFLVNKYGLDKTDKTTVTPWIYKPDLCVKL